MLLPLSSAIVLAGNLAVATKLTLIMRLQKRSRKRVDLGRVQPCKGSHHSAIVVNESSIEVGEAQEIDRM